MTQNYLAPESKINSNDLVWSPHPLIRWILSTEGTSLDHKLLFLFQYRKKMWVDGNVSDIKLGSFPVYSMDDSLYDPKILGDYFPVYGVDAYGQISKGAWFKGLKIIFVYE